MLEAGSTRRVPRGVLQAASMLRCSTVALWPTQLLAFELAANLNSMARPLATTNSN
jgi:hypothetical protein